MVQYQHAVWLFLIIIIFIGCDNAEEDWSKAKNVNSIEAYEGIRKQYPESRYDSLALDMIIELEWKDAKTIHLLEEFKIKYPNSKFRDSVDIRIDSLAVVQAEKNWRARASEKAKMVVGGIKNISVVKAEVVSLNQPRGEVELRIKGPINMDDNILGIKIPSDITVEMRFSLSAVEYDFEKLKVGSIVNLYYGRFPPKSFPTSYFGWIIDKKNYYISTLGVVGGGTFRDPEGMGRFNFVPLALHTIKY